MGYSGSTSTLAIDNRPRRAAKLYQEDIVQLVDEEEATYGLVIRCWHDAEDLPTVPEDAASDPLLRPLSQGEVGVSFYPKGTREILNESRLRLIDRSYQPGDLLKRSVDDMCAGVVTGVEVTGLLEHTISGEDVPGWKRASDVCCDIEVDMGDYVIYDNWVGQVMEMFDESIVEMSDGSLVKLPELSTRLGVGEKGTHILRVPSPGVQNLFGLLLGGVRPSHHDTVLSVKRTVLAVAWLAINQTLSTREEVTLQRPQRFWYGPDLDKLTLIRRRAEQTMRLGDRVRLKDKTNAPVTTHGKEHGSRHSVEVRTLVVKQTQTMVNVLWQDGSRELLDAKDTVPYLNPDEYDCWPGDHVLWKEDDRHHPVVVQLVNAEDRTALIHVTSNNNTDLVSLLELDPHGTTDWSSLSPNEGLGLHRGDFVFIHPEGTTNGSLNHMVPYIGEVESCFREAAGPSQPSWRNEMITLGNQIAARRDTDPNLEEGKIMRLRPGNTSLNWFGEVIDQRLDGTVEVLLPNASSIVLPLSRLSRLYDGLEQLEDMWNDESEENQGSLAAVDEGDGAGFWTLDENGCWVEEEVDGDEWSTDHEDNDMNVEAERWPLSGPSSLHVSEGDHSMEVANTENSNKGKLVLVGDTASPALQDPPDHSAKNVTEDATPWNRFEVLPSTPPDHSFFSSPPAQPTRAFLARLSKEYRVLENSLPDTILVRTYEDRTDLLRSVIIGPENTPYQDAPFVIDWQLDSNFPQTPPIAHFLSWTNGNGRVNPNLYEEGKVCLSILGTWAGDKDEMWNPARSSLLQCLISIQGLVLVKEPWFCEPAYEKLRGTEEGIVNSRLYSEKAYVLSRGFVRRALELPPSGLESELKWFYYARGALNKIVQDATSLIEKSRGTPQSAGDKEETPIPRLTGGGIISLERTLNKLRALSATQWHEPSV